MSLNKCKNCGCEDALVTLPPCPTPAGCPDPEPCSEVFNAECVIYTGDVLTPGITVQDAIDELATPAYRVYTALLTQYGGDSPVAIDTGLLTIGVTYYINNQSLGMDFTNVGAPNNIAGASTYFVATGTTPNSWGIEQGTSNATLTYNEGAPVVTVLENTIGNIWFTYSDVGSYYANSDGLFTLNKSIGISMPNQYVESPTDLYNYQILNSGVNLFYLGSTSNYAPSNNQFGGFAQNSIEIRVYN
jgi:hypothetical protein